MASAKIFRINYKSDFILTLVSDAGWMTPFCIKFWTGAPRQAFFAQWDGETYTHCSYDPSEPTKLQVQFDDHHLPIGELKFQIAYHFTVADFPTSVEDEVLNQASVIIEVDNAPAQVMLDFNGETAPEIEFSLPAYANEAQRIANEEARIAAEQQRIANEEARIAAETIRQQNEQQRIDQETARVNEFATLKSQSQAATRDANAAATLANEKAQLAADKAALADNAATLAIQKAQLAADKAALANDAAQLAADKAALAQQKAEYAQQQGGYAKDQGDYAKNQGNYAKEQGEIAQADHERAEADHGIAVDDHTQAGNDHTRAESDHGIAADDHTQAGNDHTRAESDHGIAADDHTQAGNDHTRAESDHTRAESDHAAVEPFVDSLGAFDISAYHATGGVLAKYADLTAALGTNGENIPEALRKGGMSVKYAQSSDNKYVQFRYMGTETTGSPNPFLDTDNWQGVDDVPTANSKNLVTSGGVYDALLGEYVVVTATANTGSVATAMVGIYDVNDVLIVEGEGEVTAHILHGETYKVKCSRVYDYLTPVSQTFVALLPSRAVTMTYNYIQRNTITIDQTVTDEQTMISGDVQGDVIKQIRAHSHLYLGKQTEAGNQLICQLKDDDGTKYYDGTTAAMDGTEGDQWLKLPVFWWKVTGIGTPDANDTYDQYSLSFAFAGEPDPTWHKWEGDKNLLGAKKMYVTNNKGYSRSGIQSTASIIKNNSNTYAAARGTGYSIVTWEWHCMMCVLFYAWYGRMNSQEQCGSGSSGSTRTLGAEDSLGMTDTTSANGNSDNTKFWGIEDWWGGLSEWIGNATSNDYIMTIVDMNTKQNRTVSGWYQFEGTLAYLTRFKITENLDLIPRGVAGTDTTSYCDAGNGRTGSRMCRRSYGGNYAVGGVSYVDIASVSTYTDNYCGSRLAFNGVITEAESVGDYKQA